MMDFLIFGGFVLGWVLVGFFSSLFAIEIRLCVIVRHDYQLILVLEAEVDGTVSVCQKSNVPY